MNVNYVNNYWIRTDHPIYKNLIKKISQGDNSGVTDFENTLTDARQAFHDATHMGADMTGPFNTFKDATGIISSKEYSLPDFSHIDPSDPTYGMLISLVETIAGTVITEVGVALYLVNTIVDVIFKVFTEPVTIQGIIINATNSDILLDEIINEEGRGNMDPVVQPLQEKLIGIKDIFCPIDKKNYTCASIATYSAVHAGIMSTAWFAIMDFAVSLSGTLNFGYEGAGWWNKFVTKIDGNTSIGGISITNSNTSGNFALAYFNPANIN